MNAGRVPPTHIALVPQDPVIFAVTARENIRFGRPDASDAEVEAGGEAPPPPMAFSPSCRRATTPMWANVA